MLCGKTPCECWDKLCKDWHSCTVDPLTNAKEVVEVGIYDGVPIEVESGEYNFTTLFAVKKEGK